MCVAVLGRMLRSSAVALLAALLAAPSVHASELIVANRRPMTGKRVLNAALTMLGIKKPASWKTHAIKLDARGEPFLLTGNGGKGKLTIKSGDIAGLHVEPSTQVLSVKLPTGHKERLADPRIMSSDGKRQTLEVGDLTSMSLNLLSRDALH
jgi:hypothetical protein